VCCEGYLLQVVGALHSTGSLSCGLDRRQQQGHQNADNGNHDEQLDKSKSRTLGSSTHDVPPMIRDIEQARKQNELAVKNKPSGGMDS